jgi:uncharacterized membrane protein
MLTTIGFAFLVGFLAGLRSLTPPAAVAWAAHAGWLKIQGVLTFMGSAWSVGIFTVLALGELAADKWAKIPNRTDIPPLVTRMLTGGLCGACVAISGGGSLEIGAALGAAGGVTGAFAGFHARRRLVQALGVPDFYVAVVEDLVVIGGGLWIVMAA